VRCTSLHAVIMPVQVTCVKFLQLLLLLIFFVHYFLINLVYALASILNYLLASELTSW